MAGGAVISAIGIATLTKAEKPAQKLFAGIPLLFGLQQFAEGVLWTTLKSGKYDALQNITTYIFLITALVVWPVMIPLSMWLMEEVKRRKKILIGLLITGGALSLFYAFCLIAYNVAPQIQSFHIQYIDDFPVIPVRIAFIFYVVSTIAPLFVSSVRRMWLFGVLITVSYIVTAIFFSQYLTSVWCFFAALISISIYWILRGSRSKAKTSQ
ncbi:MAG: hypothetical protein JW856_02580 [Dehalococcoidales bacterium]|nr:hypothetical protein [Dehalococcoidales bacterium]